jgi:hypothetical protein
MWPRHRHPRLGTTPPPPMARRHGPRLGTVIAALFMERTSIQDQAISKAETAAGISADNRWQQLSSAQFAPLNNAGGEGSGKRSYA